MAAVTRRKQITLLICVGFFWILAHGNNAIGNLVPFSCVLILDSGVDDMFYSSLDAGSHLFWEDQICQVKTE